jgi:predicted TIM-barrel fold metal-dependent hydrolase
MLQTRHGPIRTMDADNHYYERYDSFTRHMEPRFRDRAISIRRTESGRNIVVVGETPLRANPAHPEDFVLAPGALLSMFQTGDVPSSGLLDSKMRGADDASFVDRKARLAFMDREGLDAAVLYPSLGVMVEHQLKYDPDATFANIRAFNRWLEDDWGYGQDGRLFAVPMLSLIEIDQCCTELERVLAQGARAVHLRSAPVNGKSPADPSHDPFWARINEARIPVALHSSFSSYLEYVSPLWGEDPDPTYADITPFQAFTCMGERPICDMLAALTLHNTFGRFPNVRVLSIENGSAWLGSLLKRMDKAMVIGRRSRVAPKLDERPSEILKRHLYIAPFVEEGVDDLAEAIDPSHILFGSDWPHPEGFAHPLEFAEHLSKFGAASVSAIMGSTMASLVGAW